MIIYKDMVIQMAYIFIADYGGCCNCKHSRQMFQFGLLFTTEPLKFDLKKIDPIKGLKRIFSIRALVELSEIIIENLIYRFSDDTIVSHMNLDKVLGLAFKTPTIHCLLSANWLA